MSAKLVLSTALLLVALQGAQAGFRCTFGNAGCSTGCAFLGQTSGLCDDEGTCHCSERSISLSNLKNLLPSRCDLGVSFCEGTCNAIGRKTGICSNKDGVLDCECDEAYLSPTEFALCAAESTCRLDCQANGKATGECDGWKCKCISSKDTTDATLPVDSESVEFE